MVGGIAKPNPVPRPSSAGVREAIRILQTMDKDNKKKDTKALLVRMEEVQSHNEEVFDIASKAVIEAEDRLAVLVEAEGRQRDAAQADMQAIETEKQALADREVEFRKSQDAQDEKVQEAAAKVEKDTAANVARVQVLDESWLKVNEQNEVNKKRVAELNAAASALDDREAKLNARDARLRSAIDWGEDKAGGGR